MSSNGKKYSLKSPLFFIKSPNYVSYFVSAVCGTENIAPGVVTKSTILNTDSKFSHYQSTIVLVATWPLKT